MGLTQNPNTVIPAVAQLANMGQPNQIGAGAVPGAITPTGAIPPNPQMQAAGAEALRQQGMATTGAFGATVAPLVTPPAPQMPGPGQDVGGTPQAGVLPAVSHMSLIAQVAGSRANDPDWQEAVQEAARQLWG